MYRQLGGEKVRRSSPYTSNTLVTYFYQRRLWSFCNDKTTHTHIIFLSRWKRSAKRPRAESSSLLDPRGSCRILSIDGESEKRKGWLAGAGGERHFANWNGTGRRVFFSPFNRNTQRVYPRVPGAPGKKRNWRVQTARKYCSVSARENLLPSLLSRAEGRRQHGNRGSEREGTWTRCSREREEWMGAGNKESGGRGGNGEWAIEEEEQWGGRRVQVLRKRSVSENMVGGESGRLTIEERVSEWEENGKGSRLGLEVNSFDCETRCTGRLFSLRVGVIRRDK